MSREIIVTGGGTGIGKAIAQAFIKAGDHVTIIGRRPDVLAATATEIGATPVIGDASSAASIDSMLDQLPASVDVLVNCAGGNTDIGQPSPESLQDLAASWERNLSANVMTTVLMTEAVSSRLRDGGAVISFSSIAADRGAGSYGAAKAAVAAWNVSASRSLGQRNITASVIAPGFIDHTEFFHGRMTDERRDTIVNGTMLGRAGAPGDIAGTVLFLASPAARYITGQVIPVNGGWHTTR